MLEEEGMREGERERGREGEDENRGALVRPQPGLGERSAGKHSESAQQLQ